MLEPIPCTAKQLAAVLGTPPTAGWVAAERNQQKCHDILAEEVRQILEGLTRGSGNGAEVRPAPPPRKKEPPPPPKRAA